MNLTQRFAKFVFETDYSNLPDAVIETAKERLLDTIGAMIAGCVSWPYSRKLLQAVKPLGGGDQSPIGPCVPAEFPAARVAMINAAYAHAIELDDGHKYAGVHAGAVVIPVALAIGQELHASGENVLAAIVLGYELVYRLAAAQSPELIDHGFHPSAVCDTIGAMAVAGKLLGLNEVQLANGLGMAATEAAGLMEATVSGQQSKCVMVGNAAFTGISCAYLAREDMDGCTTAFEGKTGLFHAMSKEIGVQQITQDLGENYLIGETYSKFYPTCRHSQPAIEAVLDMAAAHKIVPGEVDHVEVGTHQVAYNLTGRIKAPKNAGEAKFSIAYGVAAALIDHRFTISHLNELHYTDVRYLELANRVNVSVNEAVNELYPKKRGAIVRIFMENGTVLEDSCYDLRGSPQNPVGLEELIHKFESCAADTLTEDTMRALIDRCRRFESEPDVDCFMKLLRW